MLLRQIPQETLQRLCHNYVLNRSKVCSNRNISFHVDSKFAIQFASRHGIVSCSELDIRVLTTALKEAYSNIIVGYASILVTQHAAYSDVILLALPIRQDATDLQAFKRVTSKVLQTLYRTPAIGVQKSQNQNALRFINDITVLFNWFSSRMSLTDFRLIEQILPTQEEIDSSVNPLDYSIVNSSFDSVDVAKILHNKECLSDEFILAFCNNFCFVSVNFHAGIVESMKSRKLPLKTAVFA